MAGDRRITSKVAGCDHPEGEGCNRLTIKPLLSDTWPWKFWLAARRPLLTLFWQEHSLKCCHLKAYCAEVEQEWGEKLWDDYQVERIWNQAWLRARNFCKDKRIKNQKETKPGQGGAGSLSSGFLPIPGEVNLSDVILGGKVAQELLLWKPWGWELFLCMAEKATIEVYTFYKFKDILKGLGGFFMVSDQVIQQHSASLLCNSS